MVLEGERVRLRSLNADDCDWVLAMLREPAVAEWWTAYDADTVQRELIDGADGEWLAVELEDMRIGVVGFWEEPEPRYRHAGIDVSLHPDWHGRGLGADAVSTLARWLLTERAHHRVTIDPAADNARAIRCYERVGFRPVGVMRGYERLPDGQLRNGLLMEMLAGEAENRLSRRARGR